MALYKQGDVVIVNFPFSDLSQTKRRPVLVISNNHVNRTGDYLLMQITSQMLNDGLSLPIESSDYVVKSLQLTSFVRLHKVFLLNESLILRKETEVKTAFYQKIVTAFQKLIL
jgi:mRNA interferase MazF